MPIPRLAHWIWFDEELPGWARSNAESFQHLHPRWSFRTWHDLPDEFPSDLRRLISYLPWYSSRSDIFRYWLLSEYGGIYLDTDIVALRSFETLLECDFFLAPCHPWEHTQPHLACGLMGSAPGSVASLRIVEACRQRARDSSEPRRITYGPDLLTSLFAGTSDDVAILPMHYFYAISDRETAHRFWHANDLGRAEIMKEVEFKFIDGEPPYAVHLWGVDGSSQRKVPDAAMSASHCNRSEAQVLGTDTFSGSN